MSFCPLGVVVGGEFCFSLIPSLHVLNFISVLLLVMIPTTTVVHFSPLQLRVWADKSWGRPLWIVWCVYEKIEVMNWCPRVESRCKVYEVQKFMHVLTLPEGGHLGDHRGDSIISDGRQIGGPMETLMESMCRTSLHFTSNRVQVDGHSCHCEVFWDGWHLNDGDAASWLTAML